MLPGRFTKGSLIAIVALAAIGGAATYFEVLHRPATGPNQFEIRTTPRGDATHVLVSWQDSANHVRSARVPVEHTEPRQRWRIEVLPLPEANLASEGRDVWLAGVAAPDPLSWSELFQAGSPQASYPDFDATKEGLQARRIELPGWTTEITGGTLMLRFRRNNRSGIARVTANGMSQVVDLYSREPDTTTLIWQPRIPASETGNARWLRTVIDGYPETIQVTAEPAASVEVSDVLLGGDRLVREGQGPYWATNRKSKSVRCAALGFLVTFLLLTTTLLLLTRAWCDKERTSAGVRIGLQLAGALSIGVFWTAVFFPANMSPDSLDQWQQALNGRYSDWHPVGMSLVMRGIHLALGAWPMQTQTAAVACLQGTLFWLAIFSLVKLACLPMRSKIVLCGAMALYYPIWLHTVTLWKDVWLALAAFLLAAWGWRFFTKGIWTWRESAKIVVLLFLAMLQRHTSWISFSAIVLLAGCRYHARLGLRKAATFALISTAVLATAACSEAVTYRLLRAKKTGGMPNWISVYEIAGTAHFSARPLASWSNLATSRAVGEANFQKAVRSWTCGGTIDYLLFRQGHPLEPQQVLQQRFALDDLPSVILADPGAFLRQRTCSIAHLLGLAGTEIHYQYQDSIQRNAWGLRESSLLPVTRRMVMRVERTASYSPVLQIPLRHFLPLLASAFGVLAMMFRRPRSANTVLVGYLFAAGIAVLFPLLLITPTSDWRYLIASNVFWVCSLLIAAASFAVPGWRAEGSGETTSA